MAYTSINFRTKKALKDAVKKWQDKEGPPVTAFQPGGISRIRLGKNTIEGPHYPEPHRWYASVTIEEVDGKTIVTKVK